MKRNITVNIFGSLYPMDEDAYAMLNAYISNMRDYFSRQPDGKEIADDIESRVAELMSELRLNGVEAISINHIQDIIERVGKPEQFIEEETETIEQEIPPIPTSAPKKRLYRDSEHKVLGGVFAGLGCYLGINPLWLRLAYILMMFPFMINLGYSFPIILLLICAYIVCWASIPLATTPADRLQMRGETVNLSNMCDEFLTSTRDLFSKETNLDIDGRLTSGLITFLRWVCYAFAILILIACVAGFIAIILSVVGAFAYPWTSARDLLGNDFPIIVVIESSPNWLIWTAVISFLIFTTITLYLAVHFIFRVLGRIRPLSTSLRVVCLIIWVASIVICTASSSKIGGNAANYYHYLYHNQSGEEKIENSKAEQKEQLAESGWRIVKDNNIENYTNQGEHYSGDRKRTYLDARILNNSLGMEYEVERLQKVAPGSYRLEAKGRANGSGAEIFAINGKGERYSEIIPVCGNKGGSIWKDAEIAMKADTAKLLPNRHYLDKLMKVNNSQGYGWSDVVIDNVIVGPDSIIRFGLTNVSPSHTWDGTWLSATSFEIIKK